MGKYLDVVSDQKKKDTWLLQLGLNVYQVKGKSIRSCKFLQFLISNKNLLPGLKHLSSAITADQQRRDFSLSSPQMG